MSPDTSLLDPFARRIDYLRLSVTDRCDFRCVYCMAEAMQFLPRAQILSLEELFAIGKAFVALGVRKIRLTGGEPLVRRDVALLAARLARLPGLAQLALTTNGSRLDSQAQALRNAGVTQLNISLDTLRPGRFRELTRTGELATVLKGIAAAQQAGFERIRLNAVILRGRNDDEVLDLVEFARSRELDLAFIEEMPLGYIDEHDRRLAFCSSDELRSQIVAQHSLLPEAGSVDLPSGPARYYRLGNSRTRIGFISPHSHNFCHLCNRVRVTVEGRLLLCLGNEHSADLRAVVRNHPDPAVGLQQAIVAAIGRKPERHHFSLDEAPQILRFMSATGG